MRRPLVFLALVVFGFGGLMVAQRDEQRWLAGDSHIHSHWSPGYDRSANPPEAIIGQDAMYPTPTNARMARAHGLSWMVTTDHGGPNHSRLNLTRAYAELQQSRAEVPELLQFYGMELNMPAMDHHTLIVPRSDDEWKTLFNIESQFDSQEAWPVDPARNSEAAAFRLLTFVNGLAQLPLMFANHPARSAVAVGAYGLDEPREFRNNHDVAPGVYRGMEGAPGHQANALAPDGRVRRDAGGRPAGNRGSYANPQAGTFGGFDQMTARVGGLWDALLGEGRRFWIVATSDSHVHYTETTRTGGDFWPGEYQKTFVLARKTYDDVLDGLRAGRIFVAAGDLVSELSVSIAAGGRSAGIGDTLRVAPGSDVAITITFRDPDSPNRRGDNPRVRRIDVIAGDVRGPASDRSSDVNETTRVVRRFGAGDWRVEHGLTIVTMTLPVTKPIYLRIRGTSTDEDEPSMDPPGEDPWSDLWMYSNPIFVETAGVGPTGD